MRLYFKKIRFKNFLSSGNQWTEIDLCSHKTTLIVGRNGAGKSTLLDALFFVLFNRPFRNINKPQLVNSINNKDCVVEVEFEINKSEMKVVRGIKPAVFLIYQDGNLLTETAETKDYQQAFEKYILKVTPKSLEQILALGSAIFVPFMSLTTPKRRAIIEDLLDLEIFTKMNILLKQKSDNNLLTLKAKENEKHLLDERHKLTEEHLNKIASSKEEQIENHRQIIFKTEGQIANTAISIRNLQEYLSSSFEALTKEKVHQQYKEEYVTLHSELSQKFRTLNSELLFFKNNLNCPTCKQVIDVDFRDNIIIQNEEKSKEIEKALRSLKENLKHIEARLSLIELDRQKKQQAENQLFQQKTEQKNLIQFKTEYENQIILTQAAEDLTNYFLKLEEIKGQLKDLEKAIFEMAEDRTLIDFTTNMLKDSGIKAKIVKTFLPVINQLIQKYLAALDFFVDFQLDEEFKETILSRHRDNFSYESFSQGEKVRLNLAIMFTWRAVAKLRSSIDCNLIVFDEILDALDNEGVDDVLQAINNLTTNDNIVIISHKEGQVSDRFSRVLKFEKVKNFGKVVE